MYLVQKIMQSARKNEDTLFKMSVKSISLLIVFIIGNARKEKRKEKVVLAAVKVEIDKFVVLV